MTWGRRNQKSHNIKDSRFKKDHAPTQERNYFRSSPKKSGITERVTVALNGTLPPWKKHTNSLTVIKGGIEMIDKLNEVIEETKTKLQKYLELSMTGDDRCPDRTYAVGMSEAYNDKLQTLLELKSLTA
jgi:hypothetical protein